MPFFKKSIFSAECERCHVRFHIGAGGVCEQCRKILCDNHLHGSLVRRVQVSFGARPVCIYCRAKPAAGTRAPTATP